MDSPGLPSQLASMTLDGSADADWSFPIKLHNSPRKWTDRQKRFICILHRWFLVSHSDGVRELNRHELRDIFLFTFDEEIPESQLPQRLTISTVHSQLKELLGKGRKSDIWKRVFLHIPFANPFLTCKAELEAIYKASLYHDFHLVFRARDNSTTPADGAVKRKFENELAKLCSSAKRARDQTLSTDYIGEFTLAKSTVASVTNWKVAQLPRMSIVIPPSRNKENLRPTKHPNDFGNETRSFNHTGRSRSTAAFLSEFEPQHNAQKLAFRFYNTETHGVRDDNGFRALSFQNEPVTPPPDCPLAFHNLAFTHLRSLPYSTVFISLFKNLQPALQRAFSSSSPARLAIVDLHQLINNHLGGRPRVFEAISVTRHFKIRGINHRTGREYDYPYERELLVWGVIERQAIVSDIAIGNVSKVRSNH